MASSSTNKTPTKKQCTQNVAFLAFSEVIEMRSKFGMFKGTEVILKLKPNALTMVRMPMDFGEVKPGIHMATDVILKEDGVLRLHNNSKILSCRPFAYNEGLIEALRNPPVKSVKEALGTPLGTKITVIGKVEQVSWAYETDLKTVTLAEENHNMAVKLWGEKSFLDTPMNQLVQISHVCAKEYKYKKDLNSTNLTTVEVIEQEMETIKGEVDAIGFGDSQEKEEEEEEKEEEKEEESEEEETERN